jgi:hypothetical protein
MRHFPSSYALLVSMFTSLKYLCFFSGNVILNIDVHLEELTARYFKELFHFLGKNMFMVIKARHLFTYQSTVKTKGQAFSVRFGHIT